MTRTARTRKHQGFDLEARLAPVEKHIERKPASWRGNWRHWQSAGASTDNSGMRTPEAEANGSDDASCARTAEAPASDTLTIPCKRATAWREVHVDLGCGKGEFATGLAKRNPDVLFVGIDSEPVCAMHGGECALEAQVNNAVFTLDENPDVLQLFAPGEVNVLYLNFSTPHPKRKHAPLRLTYVDRLLAYRTILADDGYLFVKTDSDPFMQFTRNQLELAGYEIVWETDDCRAARPDDPQTHYERKLVARGAQVFALIAKPGDAPVPAAEDIVQTAPLSLYAYLPEDLESLEYIPHGMTAGVENERYRRRREAARNDGKTTEFWTRA